MRRYSADKTTLLLGVFEMIHVDDDDGGNDQLSSRGGQGGIIEGYPESIGLRKRFF